MGGCLGHPGADSQAVSAASPLRGGRNDGQTYNFLAGGTEDRDGLQHQLRRQEQAARELQEERDRLRNALQRQNETQQRLQERCTREQQQAQELLRERDAQLRQLTVTANQAQHRVQELLCEVSDLNANVRSLEAQLDAARLAQRVDGQVLNADFPLVPELITMWRNWVVDVAFEPMVAVFEEEPLVCGRLVHASLLAALEAAHNTIDERSRQLAATLGRAPARLSPVTLAASVALLRAEFTAWAPSCPPPALPRVVELHDEDLRQAWHHAFVEALHSILLAFCLSQPPIELQMPLEPPALLPYTADNVDSICLDKPARTKSLVFVPLVPPLVQRGNVICKSHCLVKTTK